MAGVEDATIEDGAFVKEGVRVGAGSIVRAGARVLLPVPPNCEVAGDPARVVRLLDLEVDLDVAERRLVRSSSESGDLGFGCSLHRIDSTADVRGEIYVACSSSHVPFQPMRVFVSTVAHESHIRGNHAHISTAEFLIPLQGTLRVAISDGNASAVVELDAPDVGLYLPPLIWTCQYAYSHGAMLLVLASEPYRPEGYIRSISDLKVARANAIHGVP